MAPVLNLTRLAGGVLLAFSTAMAAEAITLDVYATGTNGFDYTGQFELPERFLPPQGLPLADGMIVPIANPIFFEARALRTYFWGNENWEGTGLADNRFEAGPTSDRIVLDDGNRTLILNVGPDFNGRSKTVTGIASAPRLSSSDPGAITITNGTVSTIPLPSSLSGLALGILFLIGARSRLQTRQVQKSSS